MERFLKYFYGQSRVVSLALAICSVADGAEVRVAGISEPYRDVILSAPTNGKIEKIPVKEGDAVNAEQVVIELQKSVELLEVDRRKLILEDKSEVNVAGEQVITLKSAFENSQKLFEATGSVSKEDLSIRELDYKKAKAELARLSAAEKRQAVDLQLAEETLRDMTIRSPLNGQVVALQFDAGEGCKAQDPLIRIVDTSRFFFEANLEPRHLVGLKVGAKVLVEMTTGADSKRVDGTLTFVSPVVEPRSGLVRVKALCDNSVARIRPGADGYLVLQIND
ncbi:MAG: efflux RND transporter periplasmic adaptor subunit [Limisphaerales bacterium]